MCQGKSSAKVGFIFRAYDVYPLDFPYLNGLSGDTLRLGLGATDIWVVNTGVVRAQPISVEVCFYV